MLSEKILRAILPDCRDPGAWARILNKLLEGSEVTTPAHVAEFLAHTGHESAHLNMMRENLNYSARGLRAVWPTRFPTAEVAASYARRPEQIANRVYANRLGNGSEESGDGWRYRGRGLIQITGKANYAAAGQELGLKLVERPALLEDPVHAASSALWFWQSRGLHLDTDDLLEDTRKINGGLNGLADRKALLERARAALGVKDVRLAHA